MPYKTHHVFLRLLKKLTLKEESADLWASPGLAASQSDLIALKHKTYFSYLNEKFVNYF